MAEADLQIDTRATSSTKSSRFARLALLASVPLLLVGGATVYYIVNDHYVSTDNAYVQQDKVSISAEVGGRIVHVAVRENDVVKEGDLLFRIDPDPYRIAIEQADASIAAAQVRVLSLQTEYQTTNVDIESAREDVAFYEKEYQRQSSLMQDGFTTRARLQAAEHALSDARSRVATALANAIKARAALATGSAAPGVNPAIKAGEVQREQAMLNLSRTEVRAPVSGVVSQADRLQPGQMMVQGLPGVTIVASNKSWVEANFKETDLANMRVGQPAEITFDAYPNLKVRGKVSNIGAGTGSEFSVLPAQNANGNWVKVTQRVPVRISITDKPKRAMIAGLSAHVRIDTDK
ncbi:HlyD family efflux transporter periplasmic adaptor subunit [Sphingorhabdus sp.]|jgi:membrane fusion protein (multidrug efflux system)|uniref:HlyD family efflux transporter periplasmic adaptor subunit n=1 Tax=Sphingorhabdus sp. TaxID=1902408 RepID=UPI0037C86878